MILYLGNKLSIHGNTPTSVETLGNLLKKHFDIKLVSNKKNKIFRILDMLFSIIKYRKKISYVLIDTYSTSNFYYALLSAVICNILNIKYIPILHGGDLPNRVNRSRSFSNLIFRSSYINIAPSNYLIDKLKNFNYKIKYIPNNIEISNYKFKSRVNLKPKLLYVRAFSEVYNPQMAIYVLDKLIKNYPNAELCMVGPDRDGTFDEVKKLTEKLELTNNVKFMGKMSKKDWWKLSEEYDIFINTTNFDNTPVSVMEAMALGLPVITTNVGGIPYLLEDKKDSVFVEKNDIDSMYLEIRNILENQKTSQQIIRNARKKVESFDWNVVKNDWISLLK